MLVSNSAALHKGVLSRRYLLWQWLLDLSFGCIGLLLLLLLLPCIAVCIYIDSPGPIFYVQERVGYQGRIFQIWKFRSMRIDSELNGAVWATQDDPRITRVGHVLRAIHLDELPQVVNILCGEMSLIGPRPERPMFVAQLGRTNPHFYTRLCVKPGLTGWAQVNYPYTHTYEDACIKLQYDLYYIQTRSWKLDLYILLKTCVEVLLCCGH
jgi:lipopolysaccharide/colanic/teichoic acid biosynthesis glycosyltransferase